MGVPSVVITGLIFMPTIRNANPFAFPDRVNSPECKNPVNPGNPISYIKTQCFIAPSPGR